MTQSPQAETERKPGIFASLASGFDLTTHHIWIILLPLILDVFYWIGPRLSIEKVIVESAEILSEQPAFADMADQMLQIGSRFNLFTSLSVPIIGIPALMGGTVPESTPVDPAIVQVEGSLTWLVLFLGLSLLGLALTTLYFVLISHILQDEDIDDQPNPLSYVKRLLVSYLRLIGLGIAFVLCLLAVWIPIITVALLAGLVNNSLFYLVTMLGLVLTVFIITYLSLSIPAIVFANRPVLRAIRESIGLVHKNLSSIMGLLLIVVLINNLSNLLWHMADNGSWITLVSIAGNAFISTALVMAIFIFYRDIGARMPQPLS